MKNSSVVPEMGKIGVEGGVEGVVVSCYKGKVHSQERGDFKGMKLANQILKTAQIVIEKLIRQQIEIDEMQFGIMPGYRTTNNIFIFFVPGEILKKNEEEFVLYIGIFGKSF